MKATPFSFISFLLLLLWSAIAQGAAIPNPNSQALDVTDSPALIKRGCVQSKDKQKKWECNDEIPSLQDLVKKIHEHGQVGKKDSLFYSDMGGANAISTATKWYKDTVKKGRGSVAFDDITDFGWYSAQYLALGGPSGPKVDPWQKRLSQAFAEASTGTVYFFTKEGNDGTKMPADTAWGGWEYPALTRNSHVDGIIQVSFKDGQATGQTVIWQKGDAASAQAPKG